MAGGRRQPVENSGSLQTKIGEFMFKTRKVISLISLILSIVVLSAARDASAQKNDPCFSKRTQSEMNSCEFAQYAIVDAELNSVYGKLIAKYKSNDEFVKKLRIAQESWLKFRDADLSSLYYQENIPGAYGSVHPMCKALELIRLTNERVKELKEMLSPEEGDVCAFN
jgi:uncharacterized protein YecT (DUF1311 family)